MQAVPCALGMQRSLVSCAWDFHWLNSAAKNRADSSLQGMFNVLLILLVIPTHVFHDQDTDGFLLAF